MTSIISMFFFPNFALRMLIFALDFALDFAKYPLLLSLNCDNFCWFEFWCKQVAVRDLCKSPAKLESFGRLEKFESFRSQRLEVLPKEFAMSLETVIHAFKFQHMLLHYIPTIYSITSHQNQILCFVVCFQAWKKRKATWQASWADLDPSGTISKLARQLRCLACWWGEVSWLKLLVELTKDLVAICCNGSWKSIPRIFGGFCDFQSFASRFWGCCVSYSGATIPQNPTKYDWPPRRTA